MWVSKITGFYLDPTQDMAVCLIADRLFLCLKADWVNLISVVDTIYVVRWNMAKSKYETMIKPQMGYIKALIRDGRTNKEIAMELGVSEDSLNNYRKKYKELGNLFRENRKKVDLEHVVGSYFRLCTGYTVVEKTNHYKLIDGKMVLVDTYEKEKYIPPNPNCAENWIRARLKEDPVWGSFAEDTKRNRVEEPTEESGGVVFMPERRQAKDEKIIDVQVKEVVD